MFAYILFLAAPFSMLSRLLIGSREQSLDAVSLGLQVIEAFDISPLTEHLAREILNQFHTTWTIRLDMIMNPTDAALSVGSCISLAAPIRTSIRICVMGSVVTPSVTFWLSLFRLC